MNRYSVMFSQGHDYSIPEHPLNVQPHREFRICVRANNEQSAVLKACRLMPPDFIGYFDVARATLIM